MAMKPRVKLLNGAVPFPPRRPSKKSKDTTVGDPDFADAVADQNEKNKKNMPKPPPARKMRGGGMVKKPKKMRGGGMVKKMRGGGMVKKK